MKSSLPEIFRKDLKELYLPQKQPSQFSLYLRTNNFKPHHQDSATSRYHNQSTHKINKSMDRPFESFSNIDGFTEEFKGKESLKRLLSQRKNIHSRSLFIEEKQHSNDAEQVQSFKAIRKRVMEELNLLQKSVEIVRKSQTSIRTDMEHYRARQLQGLSDYQSQMRKGIENFRTTLKALRRQTHAEIKVNKEQLTYLQEEFASFKQICDGFETHQHKFRFDLVDGSMGVKQDS